MKNADFLIYAAHTAFWWAFGITRFVLRRLRRQNPAGADAPAVAEGQEQEAPHSRLVLGFHMLAFAVMYFGIANAVVPHRVPFWFVHQRITGALVIAAGAALSSAALI